MQSLDLCGRRKRVLPALVNGMDIAYVRIFGGSFFDAV